MNDSFDSYIYYLLLLLFIGKHDRRDLWVSDSGCYGIKVLLVFTQTFCGICWKSSGDLFGWISRYPAILLHLMKISLLLC